MSDEKSYGFKLGDDKLSEPQEAPLDNLLQNGITPPAYDRLRRRVTLLSVVMPLLLAGLIIVGYLDIKRRVSQTQNTGTMEVLNLSRDLESSFSSLSVKQAKLEESMTRLIAEVQKRSDALKAGLKSDLQKTHKNIETLKIALAALEKKQLTVVEKMKTQLKSLKGEIKSVGSDLKSSDRKMTDRASSLEASVEGMQDHLVDLADAVRLAAVSTMEAKRRSEDVEEEIRSIKYALEQQLASKLDKKSLSEELRTEQLRYEKKMAQLTGRLSDRLSTLERRIALLTTYVAHIRKSGKTTTRPPQKMMEKDIKE